MINFETIAYDHCLVSGPHNNTANDDTHLLNILKTIDNRYYFAYSIYHFRNTNAIIVIVKKTTLDTIKTLFNEESLKRNNNEGPRLYDIFNPSDGQAYCQTVTPSLKILQHSKNSHFKPIPYQTIQETIETVIPNIPFRSSYNWGYDGFENNEILPFILDELDELESEN